MMEKALYNYLGLPLGLLGFRVYSLFNEKAGRAFTVRKDLFKSLSSELANLSPGKRVLIHISSVGEYFQARPIARLISRQFPRLNICLSFFSPSVDKIMNQGVEADLATYLPFDQKKSAQKFLDLLKPDLIIFSCYDLWPNLIWEAKRRGIRVALINANLAENSGKLNPLVRWWFKRIYQELDLILSASEQDRKMIAGLGINENEIFTTGNARFDETLNRIRTIPEDDDLLNLLRSWKKGRCLVFGSTWPEDNEVIVPALGKLWRAGKDFKVIIAPHEPGSRKLERLKEKFFRIGVKPVFLWEYQTRRQGTAPDSRVIIIDSTGKLYKLYQLAEIAFVGGSFRKEVHNVMEPAGFSVPVLFGPMIKNSLEAQELVKRKGGFVVRDSDQLGEQLRLFLDQEEKRLEAGRQAYQLVLDHQGAGEKILGLLAKNFPEVFEAGGGGQ